MKWKDKWFSPSRSEPLSFEHVINSIEEKDDCDIYVGCDSHTAKGHDDKYLFAVVVCLISSSSHNKYFYSRGVHKRTFSSLQERLTEEVAFSAEIASKIIKKFPGRNITLHADSNNEPRHKSSKFTELFRNWARGIGCGFASKPDAWASSSIADRHSK